MYQRNKGVQRQPAGNLVPLPIPGDRWDFVSADCITHLPKTERRNTAIFVVMDKLQSNHVKAIEQQHKMQHLGVCLAGLALGRGLCSKGVQEGAGLQAGGGCLARGRSRLRKRRKGFLPTRSTCSAATLSEGENLGTGLKKVDQERGDATVRLQVPNVSVTQRSESRENDMKVLPDSLAQDFIQQS